MPSFPLPFSSFCVPSADHPLLNKSHTEQGSLMERDQEKGGTRIKKKDEQTYSAKDSASIYPPYPSPWEQEYTGNDDIEL